MKIVFFGSSGFGIPTLSRLKDCAHELIAVVTTIDKPQGRNLKVDISPVKEWALKENLPLHQFETLKTDHAREVLKKLEADLFIVISYGLILPKEILQIPKICCLNLHASLLPLYRGASPIQATLLNGDKESGVTVIRMNERLDAGDMLLQKKISISTQDNFSSLENSLSNIGAEAILESLKLIQNNQAQFKVQSEKDATIVKKILKTDGKIDWNQPSLQIHNQVRALSQWPKAYSFYKGQRVLFLETCPSAEPKSLNAKPGQIVSASPKSGLFVATADATLEIKMLQPESKKPMPASQFLLGNKLLAGEFFE